MCNPNAYSTTYIHVHVLAHMCVCECASVCVFIHRYLAGLISSWSSVPLSLHKCAKFWTQFTCLAAKIVGSLQSARPVVVRFINLHIESPSVVALWAGMVLVGSEQGTANREQGTG